MAPLSSIEHAAVSITQSRAPQTCPEVQWSLLRMSADARGGQLRPYTLVGPAQYLGLISCTGGHWGALCTGGHCALCSVHISHFTGFTVAATLLPLLSPLLSTGHYTSLQHITHYTALQHITHYTALQHITLNLTKIRVTAHIPLPDTER